LSPRLLFKLALLPLRRSWFLLGLMIISFAELMLALWFCGSLQRELSHTESYANAAKFVSIQLKEESGSSSLDSIKDLLQGADVTFEELKTEDTLKKMEDEEPEIVQSVRAIGNEGLQLVPRVLLARGMISSDTLEKIKLMPEVYRVDATPVHHARMLKFYSHLGFEIRIAMTLILFLLVVQLLVFQRIQERDTKEVMQNLIAWGLSSARSRLPSLISLLSLGFFALVISVVEWFLFRDLVWRQSAFLGELSLDHTLAFPFGRVVFTFIAIGVVSVFLTFSGRNED